MDKGTAKVVSTGTDRMEFEVRCDKITDSLTVWFTGHMAGRQDILGLERLFGAQMGDEFTVDLEIIPPRTSTKTHLDIKAFTGKRQEHKADAKEH